MTSRGIRRVSVQEGGAADWPYDFADYYGIQSAEGKLFVLVITDLIITLEDCSFTLQVEGDNVHVGTSHWTGRVDRMRKALAVTAVEHENGRAQMRFNDDFSVLFSKPELSFDPNEIALYVRATPPSPVAPQLFPGDDVERLRSKLGEVCEYISGCTLATPGSRELICEFGIADIVGIKTIEQSFIGTATLSYKWLAPAEDVYQSMIKPSTWVPTWLPPEPCVLNPENLVSVKVSSEAPTVTKEKDQIFCVWTFHFSGVFHEVMELERFPFDVQSLQIQVDIGSIDARVQVNGMVEAPRASAIEYSWTYLARDQFKCTPTHICASCQFRRNPTSYLVRVVLILTLINALALGSFALDPLEDAADRMSICLTMMLTAVAYTYVVSDSLPELGYITLLDKVVLMTFFFLAMVTSEVAAVPLLARHTDMDVDFINSFFVLADIVILCAVLLGGLIYITCRIKPLEYEKIKNLEKSDSATMSQKRIPERATSRRSRATRYFATE